MSWNTYILINGKEYKKYRHKIKRYGKKIKNIWQRNVIDVLYIKVV